VGQSCLKMLFKCISHRKNVSWLAKSEKAPVRVAIKKLQRPQEFTKRGFFDTIES
jgi:hypothetical protein